MSLVKRDASREKLSETTYRERIEELLLQKEVNDIAMKQRLCNVIVYLTIFCVLFVSTVIILCSVGKITLDAIALGTLIVVIFGAAPRMLGRIIGAIFQRK